MIIFLRCIDDFIDSLLNVFFTMEEEKCLPSQRVNNVLSLLEITLRVTPRVLHHNTESRGASGHDERMVRSLHLGGPERDLMGRLTEVL